MAGLPNDKQALVDALLRRARWTDAVAEAEAGDAALIEALLRGDWPIPDFARQWLADRASRLAVRRVGAPTKIGDRLLALERRHYAALGYADQRKYAVELAVGYGIDIEVMEKMLRGPKVKKKPGRVSS